MRWTRTVVVGRIDPRVVTPAIAATIRRLRTLQVVDGAVLGPDDGQPLTGVRVTGTWPQPGAAFTITPRTVGDDEIATRLERIRERQRPVDGRPVPPVTEAQLRAALDRRRTVEGEILADGRDGVELAWGDGGARHHLLIEAPGAPSRIASTVVVPGGSSCLTRGELTTGTHIDVAAIAARATDRPVATLVVRHRRFVVECRVEAVFEQAGTTLTFDAGARGAGLLRPVAAVLGFVTSRLIARSLDQALADWQRDGTPPLAPFVGRTDPEAIASDLVRELLGR